MSDSAASIESSLRALGDDKVAIRVLVLDDDENLRFNLSSFLDSHGFATQCVATIEDAMQQLETGAFSAVLVDYLLAGQSGIDAIRNIRRTVPELPIIFMSAYLDEWVVSLATGFDRVFCLRKPFSGQEVLAAVRDLLGPKKR